MNSCLYKAQVMHYRLTPKQHRFQYRVYLLYLDLDEIDGLTGRLRWMSRNRFNLFNFRDKDHLQFPPEQRDTPKDIREHLTEYLRTHRIDIGRGKIMLLTNLYTLGYQLNPVSFYFCYDENGQPLCSVVEVGNTFGEITPYFLGQETLRGYTFQWKVSKYFYVSPFVDMDTYFDFGLSIPDGKLDIKIDDYNQEGKRFFISTLSGRRKKLTNANLLRYFFRMILATLKVGAILHWEDFRSWLGKTLSRKKEEQKDTPRHVITPYKRVGNGRRRVGNGRRG